MKAIIDFILNPWTAGVVAAALTVITVRAWIVFWFLLGMGRGGW